jgi:starch phosphorylase
MSTLDGWWCEGYKPDVGWLIGAGEKYNNTQYQDFVESQAIYNILEGEVIPLFYTRSADNLPRAWIRKMKNSIRWIAPVFNTHRMLAEYTRNCYNPAAARWQYLTAEAMSRARALSMWKSNMKTAWPEFAIKDVQVQLHNGQSTEKLNPNQYQLKLGSQLSIEALVKLGKTCPDDVSVEVYYGPVDSNGKITESSTVRMTQKKPADQNGEYWFFAHLPCKKVGRQGLAVRLLPNNPDLVNPYELGLILWETTSTKQVYR